MITLAALDTHSKLGTLLHVLSEHLRERFGADSNLDVQQLNMLVAADRLRVYVAMDNGVIVGYTAYLIFQELFRAHIRVAECIAVYMKPEYRQATNTKWLIQFSERELRLHCQVNQVSASTNLDPKFQKYYARLGYKAINTQVTKDV